MNSFAAAVLKTMCVSTTAGVDACICDNVFLQWALIATAAVGIGLILDMCFKDRASTTVTTQGEASETPPITIPAALVKLPRATRKEFDDMRQKRRNSVN